MQLQLESTKIYVAYKPVDFRKGIDGLSEYVLNEYAGSLNQCIYIFHNKGKDKLKVLFWHNNGFVLLQKRLEKGKFVTPTSDKNTAITNQQLSWLIAGLDWSSMSNWKELTYEDYY